MSHFFYYAGLILFSKAFVYGLGAVVLFAVAAQGRREPDTTHFQPWRRFLAMGWAMVFITVVEASTQFPIPKSVVDVCGILSLGIAVYLLWASALSWRKTRREGRRGLDINSGPR